jgi:hypothetical protein
LVVPTLEAVPPGRDFQTDSMRNVDALCPLINCV